MSFQETSQEKRYHCKHCKASYKHRQDRWRHKAQVAGKYTCKDCGKRCTSLGRLKIHNCKRPSRANSAPANKPATEPTPPLLTHCGTKSTTPIASDTLGNQQLRRFMPNVVFYKLGLHTKQMLKILQNCADCTKYLTF